MFAMPAIATRMSPKETKRVLDSTLIGTGSNAFLSVFDKVGKNTIPYYCN